MSKLDYEFKDKTLLKRAVTHSSKSNENYEVFRNRFSWNIYIKRRKNWFQRQRVAVGEAIYVSDYFTSRFPSMEEINKVTELVRVKEMKLKEMVGEKNEN